MRQFSCISDHKRWPDHQHHGKEIDGACLVAGTQQLLLSYTMRREPMQMLRQMFGIPDRI